MKAEHSGKAENNTASTCPSRHVVASLPSENTSGNVRGMGEALTCLADSGGSDGKQLVQ